MTTMIVSSLAIGGVAGAADTSKDTMRNDAANTTKTETQMKSGVNADGSAKDPAATTNTDTQARTGNVNTDAGAAGDRSYGSYSLSEGFRGDIAGGYTAEDLIGKDILDVNGDTIGEIGDLLIDSDNKVSSVLVDVGGFLGIGEKRVAMQLSELTRAKDGFTTAATEEQLKSRVSYIGSEKRWLPDMRDDSRAAPASPAGTGAPAR
jgi:sporulation protein YlmC with PRC-barrel domain